MGEWRDAQEQLQALQEEDNDETDGAEPLKVDWVPCELAGQETNRTIDWQCWRECRLSGQIRPTKTMCAGCPVPKLVAAVRAASSFLPALCPPEGTPAHTIGTAEYFDLVRQAKKACIEALAALGEAKETR